MHIYKKRILITCNFRNFSDNKALRPKETKQFSLGFWIDNQCFHFNNDF